MAYLMPRKGNGHLLCLPPGVETDGESEETQSGQKRKRKDVKTVESQDPASKKVATDGIIIPDGEHILYVIAPLS